MAKAKTPNAFTNFLAVLEESNPPTITYSPMQEGDTLIGKPSSIVVKATAFAYAQERRLRVLNTMIEDEADPGEQARLTGEAEEANELALMATLFARTQMKLEFGVKTTARPTFRQKGASIVVVATPQDAAEYDGALANVRRRAEMRAEANAGGVPVPRRSVQAFVGGLEVDMDTVLSQLPPELAARLQEANEAFLNGGDPFAGA